MLFIAMKSMYLASSILWGLFKVQLCYLDLLTFISEGGIGGLRSPMRAFSDHGLANNVSGKLKITLKRIILV